MVEKSNVLAIVPARGGSKSIPRKNIRPFAGHPLLAYSVAAALQADRVGRVIVSTDDDEIAEVARQYGAETPFLRPVELAQDDTLDLPVFQQALQWLAHETGYQPEIVVQLRPTSPLRPPGLVDQAIERLVQDATADSVRGVVSSGQNPYKMWRMGPGAELKPLLQDGPVEAYNRPRQELPPTYWQTGHIDAIRRSTILEQNSMSGQRILGIEIPSQYTVDIDNELDWRRAEAIALAGGLSCISPAAQARLLPGEIELLVLDFDGVLTDNRVWVNAQGEEFVAAHRGDGWGLARLKEAGVKVVVLSTETDPVVSARCRKLDIPVHQGLNDKAAALEALMNDEGLQAQSTVFVGNDMNDVSCFPLVAYAMVPADAHPSAAAKADRVLDAAGGYGAVREVCDLILRTTNRRE